MIVKKLFLVGALCIFSSCIFADSDLDPLANVKVSKSELMQSLEKLYKDGSIKKEDYEKAKVDLVKMSDSQVTSLTETAVGIIKADPDKALEMAKGKVDFEKVDAAAKEASKK